MPGTAQVGKTTAILQKEEQYYDSQGGFGTRQTWVGSRAAIDALSAQIAGQGIRFTTSQKGPSKTLVCDIAGVVGGGALDVVDTYEFDAEWAQESIWANPGVIAAASTTQTLADWKYQIETALANKPPTPLTGTVDPGMQAIYDLRARGVESFEARRIVFRRTRTLPILHPSKVVMDALEDIWTTAQLISDFALPSFIAAQFPANPTDIPVGCIWGWKYRRDNSLTTVGIGGKKQEVKEWVFAAWPVIMYDVS